MSNNFTLITGAAGFLGYYHCCSLIEIDKPIIAVDINQKKIIKLKKKLFSEFNVKKIHFFKVDITREKEIIKIKNNLKKKNKNRLYYK